MVNELIFVYSSAFRIAKVAFSASGGSFFLLCFHVNQIRHFLRFARLLAPNCVFTLLGHSILLHTACTASYEASSASFRSNSVFDQICIEQIERESGATFSLIDSLCSSSSFRGVSHCVIQFLICSQIVQVSASQCDLQISAI